MKTVRIQREPIDGAALLKGLGTAKDGAVLTFTGTARGLSRGKEVTHLHYEAYEAMALKELHRIADEAAARWAVTGCLIVHRTGRVEIGEASVLIAVASPHREEGFASLRYIIDAIKKTVPVWKKEFYADGSAWISEGA